MFLLYCIPHKIVEHHILELCIISYHYCSPCMIKVLPSVGLYTHCLTITDAVIDKRNCITQLSIYQTFPMKKGLAVIYHAFRILPSKSHKTNFFEFLHHF